MVWISRFRGSGKTEPADPWRESVLNGPPHDAHEAIRRTGDPGERSDAQIAEEIKRRQVSLAVRYVAAVRAR
jgi:hypothetical protein